MATSDLHEEPVNVDPEDEDGYDDDDEEEKNASEMLGLYEKIVEEAKSRRPGDQNQRDWEKFWEQFLADKSLPVLTARTTQKQQNLLHLLAEPIRDVPHSSIESLVKALVKHEGNLLAKQDFNSQTPLFYALMLRNHDLVRTMCDAHEEIDSILGIVCGRGTNCLHTAITNKFNDDDDNLVKFLINKSSSETICAPNEFGLTPLHLAVEYPRCDAAQVQIVRSIVEKCVKSLDATYEYKDKGPLSPYRYHQETKTEREAIDKAELTSRDNSSLPRQQQKQYNPQPLPDLPDTSQRQPPRRTSSYVEAPTGKFSTPSVNKPKVTQAPRSELTIEPESTKKKAKKIKGSKIKYNEESASKIKSFLKLQYLREKNHDDATDLLYGPQQCESSFCIISWVSL